MWIKSLTLIHKDSSKRLSKNQLGSFGLGAKSLLATGIDYYTVTSYYNGRQYSFNVFKDHVVSAISKFNDDGSTNDIEVFFAGTENEYSVYFRTTKELNGVIIEAEVKRHRKFDFINSIENQLGFIPDIELLMLDGQMEFFDPVPRSISTKVLFSSPEILVGDTDYYAVPQILLKPGADSNIKISYGTINFEELEMKKYSGNVSFIMNINDVDVTPSRENVIWNTKTREAIKKMFNTAQNTVMNIIEEKIKGEKTLPDYLALLSTFKDKNAIAGLSELYKIIDTSKIDNTFRDFNIGKAALQLDEELKKDLIFTSTPNLNSYGAAKFTDTTYASALSNEYISKLSPKKGPSSVIIYVGDTKYKNLAKYAASEYSIDDKNIDIIYIKDELFNDYSTKTTEMGLDVFIDKAYVEKDFLSVLIGEVIRFATAPATRSRVMSTIDTAKMSNMDKIQEEADARKYLTWAEQQKASGKVIGNLHGSPSSTYREYIDESTIGNAIIYQLGDSFCESLFRNASSLPSKTRLIGLSQENFKRFYKLSGIKVLVDCLYEIKFGDISFTELGMCFLNQKTRDNIATMYSKSKHSPDIREGLFSFLNGSFKDFTINNSTFDYTVRNRVNTYKNEYKNYLKPEKTCKCEKCKTL